MPGFIILPNATQLKITAFMSLKYKKKRYTM